MAEASTVFALPELLENIILYLPLRSIQIAKRTNKNFRDTSNASILVRRALFLEPATNIQVSWRRRRGRGNGSWKDKAGKAIPLILNPFLALENQGLLNQLYTKQWYHKQERGQNFPEHSRLVQRHLQDISRACLYLCRNELFLLGPVESGCRIFHFESDHDDKSDLIASLQNSESSFKRMAISHPPISELSIDDSILKPREDKGFSMDDLLDSALALSGVDENENDFEIEGFDYCRILAKTVDEITGWQMIHIFSLVEWQLEEEGLLLNDRVSINVE